VRYDESQRIRTRIGRHIRSRYPILTPEEAVLAFLDFTPDDCHQSYEEHQRTYSEAFLQAYICSLLERDPRPALRSIAPVVWENTPHNVRVALMNNDFPLRFNDRDAIMDIIKMAAKEFESALESVAETREDAKMIFVSIVSRKGRKESVRPIAV